MLVVLPRATEAAAGAMGGGAVPRERCKLPKQGWVDTLSADRC